MRRFLFQKIRLSLKELKVTVAILSVVLLARRCGKVNATGTKTPTSPL